MLGLDGIPAPADLVYRAHVAELLSDARARALEVLAPPEPPEAPERPLTPRKPHPWQIARARRLGLPTPVS